VRHLDALMKARLFDVADVEVVAARHPGVRGLRQLRETLGLVDGGAESPYESLTRLLLIQYGFPRPQTQVPVYDERGRLFAHIDIGWPEYRVGVDFEGKHHWTEPRQRDWDVERSAGILRSRRGSVDLAGVPQNLVTTLTPRAGRGGRRAGASAVPGRAPSPR
jgi:hypothetical protein